MGQPATLEGELELGVILPGFKFCFCPFEAVWL